VTSQAPGSPGLGAEQVPVATEDSGCGIGAQAHTSDADAEALSVGRELWERHAAWWQAGFTGGADPEYEEQILPHIKAELTGAKRVLDVGCGEGQVARLAGSVDGVELVVGVDPSYAQVTEAARRGGGVRLARSEASGLPFPDATFDTVIACLVFEHVTALDEAIGEVGRVLAPGGVFVFLLNHPLLQTPGSGWIDDTILEEQYWRIGPYLVEDVSLEEVEKQVWIPFVHRPLSRYVNAMVAAGLYVTSMAEPPPPAGFLARAEEYKEAASIPRLLALRAEKLPRTPKGG
jgi:SAM-dependent methyltransferase